MEHIDSEVSSGEKGEVTDGQEKYTFVQVPEEHLTGSLQTIHNNAEGCEVLQGMGKERTTDHDDSDSGEISDCENKNTRGEFRLDRSHGIQSKLSHESPNAENDTDLINRTSSTDESHKERDMCHEGSTQFRERSEEQQEDNVYEQDIHSVIEYMDELYMQESDFEENDEISDNRDTNKTGLDANSTDIQPREMSEQIEERARVKHGSEAEGNGQSTGKSQENTMKHNDKKSEIMFQAHQASLKVVPGICSEDARVSHSDPDENKIPFYSSVMLANEQVGSLPCDLQDNELCKYTTKEYIAQTENKETNGYVTKSLLVTGWDGEPEVACLIRGPQHLLEDLGVSCYLSDRYQHHQQQSEDDYQELLSHVLCLQPKGQRLPQAVTVCVPYTVRGPRSLAGEVVGKIWRGGAQWEVILPKALDCVYPDSEDDVFAEFSLHELPTIAVVLRLTNEHLLVDKEGGSFKSSVDPRILLNVPKDFTKSSVQLSLQVQPVPVAVVASLQTARDPADADACLIATSPIVSLGGAARFMRPLVLVLPCPRFAVGVRARTVPTVSSHVGRSVTTRHIRKQDDEVLRLVAQPTVGGHWTELSDVGILSRKSDSVQVELHRPVRRLLLLRLAARSRGVAMAGAVIEAVRSRQAVVLAQRHGADAGRLAVVCCALSGLEEAEEALQKAGFSGPPGPSHPFPAHEGQELYLHFTSTGNIMAIRTGVSTRMALGEVAVPEGEQRLTFHAHRHSRLQLRLRERDPFANRGHQNYRGALHVMSTPASRGRGDLQLCSLALTLPKKLNNFQPQIKINPIVGNSCASNLI
ncbi:death domain-containing protein 1-like [Petromyzon marinus]|uniref:death domain-containing protein 1-like n=1 Tax=Petromyzon marinus TaxID=7757 RepID=UPI003F711FBD